MRAPRGYVERSLYAAGRQAEVVAARARLGLVLAGFLIVGGLMAVSEEPVAAGPVMLASIALWGAYALAVEAVLRRAYSPAIGYLTVGLDLLALGTVSLGTAIANGNFADTTKTPWTIAFFLVIAAAGLRQEPRLAVAAGVFASIIYLLLFLVTAALAPLRVTGPRVLADWGGPDVSPLRVAIVIAVMLVTGALTAVVGARARGLVRRAVNTGIRAVSARAQRDALRTAFERYLPEPEAVRMIESGAAPRLGGERRTVTILSTDIRGFTSRSEQLPPEALVASLNAYWEEMVKVLFEHRGTLIDFEGDGLIAAFGLPRAAPDDADRALATAVAMRRRIRELNDSGALLPLGPLHVGMAIHTGPVVAGNIGSSKRLEYTVIGDAMNTAARLEAMNKVLGTELLISGVTVEKLATRDGLVDVGDLEIRGRSEHLRAYAYVGERLGAGAVLTARKASG